MFRKISSACAAAAAAAHSFSSLASPNGKLSSLFTRPPKSTPLHSRNWRSRFTIPAETTSSSPNNSHYEPKIGIPPARLEKFLDRNCKSGDVSADEAFGFFHRMVEMEPRFNMFGYVDTERILNPAMRRELKKEKAREAAKERKERKKQLYSFIDSYPSPCAEGLLYYN